MKRYKKLCVLLGVLVVVCAITFGVTRFQQVKEDISNSDEIILEIDSSAVQTLSWTYDSNTLSFHRDGDWVYDEDEAFPVDETKMEDLLEPFTSFGVSFVIENVEDYGQYGLDEPVCTIDLTTDQDSYQITLGSYSTMDEKRYVSIGDGNVYLVDHDPLEEYDAVLSDLIRNDKMPDLDSVTTIQFSGAQDYSIYYLEDSVNTYCVDDVYFVQDQDLPLSTTRTEGYLNTLRFLSLTNYANYKVTEEELANYGLDNPDLTVTVAYTEEDDDGNAVDGTVKLSVGRTQEQKEQAQEAEEGEDVSAYVRVGDSSIIYEITGTDYDNLMAASYDDLRHQEVYAGDVSQIYQVDVTLDGESYTLTADQAEDSTVWSFDGNEVDATDFETALTGLTASSFTDQDPTGGEEVELTLYLTDDNFPSVKITLYRQDGTYCLAQVDGASMCLVERSAVVSLVEAINGIVLG
ncbi:DUF4340 domain-containing protein [Pseudoflavonifractor sp. An85]|uniref:DUF4340 domain-containing protein n=1 Tax=Pseudoflavonifractor sp. An85 TaxID=1965661 RepID=UPI000B3A32C0|nr:DUF4340 domain-containing protein [Pseudoflavonifractor sp. An85]OUN21966.1 hypothetical protein B5G37_10680 [Pseudoflavonifractor sp. An85]